MRDKVSGAIVVPKASWGCAPALPNRIRMIFLRAMFHMKHHIKNCTCFNETGAMNLFFEKPTAYGSAESLRYLPSCCSPVVALPELVMNLS